jgi:hypothetical protein
MIDATESVQRISDILTIKGEMAGLSWRTDTPRIMELCGAIDALEPFRRPRDGEEARGLYRGCEDFCSVWLPGHLEPLPFLWAAADLIAREVVQEFTTPEVLNSLGFAHLFGADGVCALLAVLRASAPSFELQHRRMERVDEDGEGRATATRIAPIGTDDPDFDESPIVCCGADDEHAAPVTFIDLDDESYGELRNLIEKKSETAKRAYLRPPPPTDPLGYVLNALDGFRRDPATTDYQSGFRAGLEIVAREAFGVDPSAEPTPGKVPTLAGNL